MTRTAGGSNPQVMEGIRALPQVAKSGSRTLSRWRHGFNPVGTTSKNSHVYCFRGARDSSTPIIDAPLRSEASGCDAM
jgi:hypothetical protein